MWKHWSICRFLATYGQTRFFRYPLLVEKREHPDYRMSSRDLVVGIEITEAMSEDMTRTDAMRYDEDDVVFLNLSSFVLYGSLASLDAGASHNSRRLPLFSDTEAS